MNDDEALAAAGLADRPKKVDSIFDMFETDENIETSGIWINYGKGRRILVARAGGSNKKFERLIRDLTKPHRKAIKGESIDEETMTAILQEAYAKAVVLKWEGITEKDGTLIVCNWQNTMSLFKRLPALWTDLRDFAADFRNFLHNEEDVDEAVKN